MKLSLQKAHARWAKDYGDTCEDGSRVTHKHIKTNEKTNFLLEILYNYHQISVGIIAVLNFLTFRSALSLTLLT